MQPYTLKITVPTPGTPVQLSSDISLRAVRLSFQPAQKAVSAPASFGKISVATPGTPVRVTTDTTIRAARMRFAVLIGEAGRTFLGVSGMNKTTGAGVLKEFWPTGAGGAIADQYTLEAPAGSNTLRPSDYWVDANTANEGLMAGYWKKQGSVYVGTSTMNKSTGAGVMREFSPDAFGDGVANLLELGSADGGNRLQLSQYYVDADTTSDGVLVTYWVQ